MTSEGRDGEEVIGTAAPVAAADRLRSLDVVRGVAILGILVMNSLDFGLETAAYFNVSAGGVGQPVDWVVGILAMVFVDQKMMALFSMLFGVGVVVFADRAAANARRVVWLSLWRFALLFAVGLAHLSVWDGDVLTLYAVCAPIVLMMRRLPVWILGVAGTASALTGIVSAPFFQSAIGSDPDDLGGMWFAGYDWLSPTAEAWYILNATGRALGLMLIGVALFRLGIVQGRRSDEFYRRLAVWGIGVGTVVTTVGPVIHIATDWSADYAIVGTIPTGLGTVPMALGYLSLVVVWSRSSSRLVDRLGSAGRVALSNYLVQTALGLVTFGWLLGDVDVTRTAILVWVAGVWVLQLWWSTWWLARFRYGPFEWAWRCATYRSWQSFRRLGA